MIQPRLPLTIKAPAKINLSLEVLGKRPDGYHDLDSLMCPLTLADELTICASETSGIVLRCSDPTLPTGPDNLVCKAATLFFERTGAAGGVTIDLTKMIPHGAGLGGGSSDAASTIIGLNQLFRTAIPLQTLAEWASQIGSDVPFFIYQSVARIRGRGEIVEPVSFLHALPLLLIKPAFGIPTPWAYQRLAASRELSDIPYAPQVFPWGTLMNHLERPVFEKYLFLAVLKRWLIAQPEVEGALMSGSGSTTFAVLKSPNLADSLAEKVRDEFGESTWVQPSEIVP